MGKSRYKPENPKASAHACVAMRLVFTSLTVDKDGKFDSRSINQEFHLLMSF